jgi:hypothetical protein
MSRVGFSASTATELSTISPAGPASKRAPGQLRGEVKLGTDLPLVKWCL